MYQLTAVIVAKRNSVRACVRTRTRVRMHEEMWTDKVCQDYLKQPFNLVWIFWQPLENFFLVRIERRRDRNVLWRGRDLKDSQVRLEPMVVAALGTDVLPEDHDEDKERARADRDPEVAMAQEWVTIEDPEQLLIGCPLMHTVRGQGTLVAKENAKEKGFEVQFDELHDQHTYSAAQMRNKFKFGRDEEGSQDALKDEKVHQVTTSIRLQGRTGYKVNQITR